MEKYVQIIGPSDKVELWDRCNLYITLCQFKDAEDDKFCIQGVVISPKYDPCIYRKMTALYSTIDELYQIIDLMKVARNSKLMKPNGYCTMFDGRNGMMISPTKERLVCFQFIINSRIDNEHPFYMTKGSYDEFLSILQTYHSKTNIENEKINCGWRSTLL